MMKAEPVLSGTKTYNIINMMHLREHLKKLAVLSKRKPKIGFNMMSYEPVGVSDGSPYECKTSCCIAGHAALLGKFAPNHGNHISRFAQNWLGLPIEEAILLFGGTFSKKQMDQITIEDVIEVLDYMILHGEMPLAK